MKFYTYINETITKSDLNKLEAWLDKLFATVDIDIEFTRHFLERVNDTRNKKDITIEELSTLFKDTYSKHGKKISILSKDTEAVLNDLRSDINIPFVLKWDSQSKEFDLVSKTVMRKKQFKTPDRKFIIP